MALLECPTRNDLPAYSYTIQLDGVTYTLSFNFNPRMGVWFISLGDGFGNPICASVPVTVMWPLFDRFVAVAIPPGRIFAYDTTNSNTDPGEFDLGDRVRILYDEASTK